MYIETFGIFINVDSQRRKVGFNLYNLTVRWLIWSVCIEALNLKRKKKDASRQNLLKMIYIRRRKESNNKAPLFFLYISYEFLFIYFFFYKLSFFLNWLTGLWKIYSIYLAHILKNCIKNIKLYNPYYNYEFLFIFNDVAKCRLNVAIFIPWFLILESMGYSNYFILQYSLFFFFFIYVSGLKYRVNHLKNDFWGPISPLYQS